MLLVTVAFALTLLLILVLMLAFSVVGRPHPLIAITIIEIARTGIKTGSLTSVFFICTFLRRIALSQRR